MPPSKIHTKYVFAEHVCQNYNLTIYYMPILTFNIASYELVVGGSGVCFI